MSTTLLNAITNGLSTAGDNISSILGTIVPVALGIVGTIIAIKFGVRFFKGLVSG